MSKQQVLPRFGVHPSYKGGCTTEYGGYVYEFCPGHRLQNRWGFVAQHRMVAEDKLGRPLAKGEVVHHKDECPTNNHPDNLEVMTKSQHHSHHSRRRAEEMRARLNDRAVQDALKGRSLKEAASFLGCHAQTLRNHVAHLLVGRVRRSPTKIDDPKAIATVLKYAPDPAIGLRDVVRMTGMSAMTALRICERNGVQWVKKGRFHPLRQSATATPSE